MKLALLTLISLVFQIISVNAQDLESAELIDQNKDYKEAYIPEEYRFIVQLDYQQSLDSLNSLVKSYPENSELYYYRAWSHYYHHEYFLAFEDINLYLKGESHVQKYFGLILLAKLHGIRKSTSQAILEFDKAISVQPEFPYAFIEKAKLYGYSEITPDLEFIRKAKIKFPEEVELHLYGGLMFFKTKNLAKSISDFQAFINSDKPKNNAQLAIAHLGLAKINLSKKEYEAALTEVNNSITLCSAALAYGVRGEVFYKLNRHEEALQDFVAMQKCCHLSYYNKMIADSYEKTGDLKSACEYYNLACDPERDRESCNKIKKLKCNTQ